MNKRPWNAADAVKEITREWALSNDSTGYLGLEGPNKWREMYELPKLIYNPDMQSENRVIEE